MQREPNDVTNMLPSIVPSAFLQQPLLTAEANPWQTQLLEQLHPALMPSTIIIHTDDVPTTTTLPDPTQAAVSSSSDCVGERRLSTSSAVRPRRVFDQHCVVCGDVASGMHYSVASCNGCKTFFRRTFLRGRNYKCDNDCKCPIDHRARNTCRACRFTKCIDSGMDPEVIQPSREMNYGVRSASHMSHSVCTAKDLEVLLGNFKSRRADTPLSSPGSSSSISSTVPVPPHLDTKSLQDSFDCDEFKDLLSREVKLYSLKKSGGYRGGALLDILTRPPAIEMQSLLEITTKWPVSVNAQSRTIFMLNYDLSISIEYAKTNEVFRNLSFCDKCLLLEDTHVALFIFTAAYEAYFNQDKYIRYSNGDEVILGETIGSPNDLIDMMVRCSLDAATFVIVKSIILLNPDIVGLSSEGIIQLEEERERYLRLLSSYLFKKFGDGGASIRYECSILTATVLSLGRRFRLHPPENVPLLHLTPHFASS